MAKSAQLKICGREREQRLLQACLDSPRAELLAVYGRRRVGKTFLIREFFHTRADCFFMATGEKDGRLDTQLHHFRKEMERVFNDGRPLPPLVSWRTALDFLCERVHVHLEEKPQSQVVLFFDELPWLATRRSGLMQAIDRAWNTSLSTLPQVLLVLCGSAAAWMLDKLVHAKGGLYNRVTRRIALRPFTLRETESFLRAQRVTLDRFQLLELYMAMGGVPHYLEQVEPGRSAQQNIAHALFDPNGLLRNEYQHLFAALFSDPQGHERIVRALATKGTGMMRSELQQASGFSSGGALAARLRELEAAGFIGSFVPVGKKTKHTHFRVVDEYVLFYLKWLEKAPKESSRAEKYWYHKAQSPSYRAWSGYAFENICVKHETRIAAALGLENIGVHVGPWRYVPPRNSPEQGAQIDLLYDRDDGVITLCEMKFCADEFTITKSYAAHLKRAIEVFERQTRTNKTVQWALVTPRGLLQNTWSLGLIEHVVTAESLFGA